MVNSFVATQDWQVVVSDSDETSGIAPAGCILNTDELHSLEVRVEGVDIFGIPFSQDFTAAPGARVSLEELTLRPLYASLSVSVRSVTQDPTSVSVAFKHI